MDINWYLAYADDTRRRDAERSQAKKALLVREALNGQSPCLKLYQRGLVRLGDLLVNWGNRLQHRYERMVAVGAPANLSEVNPGPC
jgi:hypothetical protein